MPDLIIHPCNMKLEDDQTGYTAKAVGGNGDYMCGIMDACAIAQHSTAGVRKQLFLA